MQPLASFLIVAALVTSLQPNPVQQKKRPAKPQTAAASFRDQAMLAKLLSRYRGMRSLTQSVKGKMVINMDGVKIEANIASKVALAQPNRFRIDSTVSFMGEEKHGLVVSDGTTAFDLDVDAKQFSEKPMAEIARVEDRFTDWLMDRGGLDLSIMFFLEAASARSLGLPKGLDKALDIRGYPTRTIDGTGMYVVPVPISKGAAKGRKDSATLYLDAKEMLIRRLRYTVTPPAGKDGPKSLSVDIALFYTDVAPDAALPEDSFTFAAPEGATKVDSVQPVFDRAFNSK